MKMQLPSGIKVRIELHYGDRDRGRKGIYHCTVLKVLSEDGTHLVASGQAECSPADTFNKKVGRKLALRDAFRAPCLLTGADKGVIANALIGGPRPDLGVRARAKEALAGVLSVLATVGVEIDEDIRPSVERAIGQEIVKSFLPRRRRKPAKV